MDEAQPMTDPSLGHGIEIIAPRFTTVQCPACLGEIPAAFAYRIVDRRATDKVGETFACSADCAEHIRRVMQDGRA